MEMPSLHLHCCWTRRRCFHLSVCLFFWCTRLFNTQSAPHLRPLTFAEHILNASFSYCQQLELLPHPTCPCWGFLFVCLVVSCFVLFFGGGVPSIITWFKLKRLICEREHIHLWHLSLSLFFPNNHILCWKNKSANINCAGDEGVPFSAVSSGWILFSQFLLHRSANSPHQ